LPTSMTSRERIECALECKTPDRVPVSPFGLGRLDPDSQFAWEFIRATDPFVGVGVGGGNVFLGTGVKTESRRQGDVTVIIYHTSRGDMRSSYRHTAQTTGHVEFPCKTADDVEKLLSIAYEPPEPDVTEFLRWRERVGDEGLVLADIGNAICWAAEMFSPQDFCLLWADAPDAMIEMTRVANQRLCQWVEKACRKGVDGFRIVGGEYASTQLGPKAFDVLCRRLDKQLIAVMREHGAWAYYHNHGPIMRYLDMIIDIAPHALDPLEAPPWGDCDIQAAKAKLQGKICIVGNLDDMEVMEKREIDEIKAMGRRLIRQAGPDGFCLGGTASGTYTERAAQALMALVGVAQEEAVAE
jgi:uroporphyrinogen-III decarboxylase